MQAYMPYIGLSIRRTLLTFARSFSAQRLGLISKTMTSLPPMDTICWTQSDLWLHSTLTLQPSSVSPSTAWRPPGAFIHHWPKEHKGDPVPWPNVTVSSCWHHGQTRAFLSLPCWAVWWIQSFLVILNPTYLPLHGLVLTLCSVLAQGWVNSLHCNLG